MSANTLTQVTTHKADAATKLTDQFKGRKVIGGLLAAVTTSVQELENVFFDILNKRLLTNATAAQLDTIGSLVGEPRNSRDDTTYKRAVQTRIMINRSQGRAEDVIQVVASLLGATFTYTEDYPAGFVIDIPAATTIAAELLKSIKQTRAVGVYAILQFFTTSSPAQATWSDSVSEGIVVDHDHGFGFYLGGSTGGVLISAQVT